jgi:hypothetical protein
MFNVINHLDEDAVSLLHKDSAAIEKYVTILQVAVHFLVVLRWRQVVG